MIPFANYAHLVCKPLEISSTSTACCTLSERSKADITDSLRFSAEQEIEGLYKPQ